MQWHATIQEFLTSLQTERNTSANTIMAYRNDLSQFADYLNTALPEELTWTSLNQGHLSDFVASIASKYATSTIARKIAAIKTLFTGCTTKAWSRMTPRCD